MRRTERLAVAARIAREAAQTIRTSTRPHRVRLKASVADIQTSTDRKVERLIRRRLADAFPGEAIVGEEGDGFAPFSLDRPTWFVDPVDGTTNYFRGIPLVACNLAFWDGERLEAAVVADVAHRRLYTASAGRGAWCGRHRLRVGGERVLERAVVSTGFPSDRAVNADNNLAEFADLVLRVRDVRRIGVAGLDLGYVAGGMLDAYWERGDGPWDWAAGALLVREAGGLATTWDGAPWRPGDETMVASNGRVHDAVLERLAAVRAGAVAAPGAVNDNTTSLGYIALAFALCAVIGLEREYRQKSAGLRTHVLVGLGATLFMLVSKYGFADMLGLRGVALDPSRVAAQIVSGIGFIGGGLIFVRRDAVRGLTTAASVWLAASVGAAAGAGLLFLACAVTAAYLVVAFVFPAISARLPRSPAEAVLLRVGYADGRGLLRDIIRECTGAGFHVAGLRMAGGGPADAAPERIGVLLELSGHGARDELVPRLSERDGITEVTLLDDEAD